MPIFKTKGYRDTDCVLSVAAVFPPEKRELKDRKNEDEETFHFTIVNNKDQKDERSAYISLSTKQLRQLNTLIESYLNTGTTKEL